MYYAAILLAKGLYTCELIRFCGKSAKEGLCKKGYQFLCDKG